MAITETRPETEPVAETAEVERYVGLPEQDQPGLLGFVGSADHTSIGRIYVVLSLLFGVVGFALAGVNEADLTRSNPWKHLFQVYTASRVSLVFLFAIPLLVGLATVITPLQVGANTVAFPRAAAAGLWGWIIGSGLVIASYAVDGGPLGGHTKAVDLTYAGFALVIVALLVASTCIVTTVVSLRAPGMFLDRVPMFSWSMVVAASVWLLSLPVLLGNIVLVYVDHHYGRPAFFAAGPNQWTQISWTFAQPAIYAIAIPVLGIASDSVAAMTGRRMPHRSTVMALIGAFGILSFGAWAQPVYYSDVYNEALFIAFSVLIILPVLGLLGGWGATLRGGRPTLASPLLYAVGAGVLALIATVAGAIYGIKALDLHDPAWAKLATTLPFADGLFMLVVSATALGAIGGVVLWSSKLFGRVAQEGLAKLGAAVGTIGGLVAGLPLLVYGFAVKAHGLKDSNHFLRGTSAFGDALVLLAIVIAVAALISGGRTDEPDPWGDGQTFEWQTASPAAGGGFGQLEPVTSAEPLLDLAAAEQEAGS
jgi:heme/copper-type cytochrome/quinol oxidase subunit 1